MLSLKERREKITLIYNSFWGAFDCEDYEAVDIVLRSIDPCTEDTTVLIGYLGASLPAKDFLKERANFVLKAKTEFLIRDPERAHKLMDGLE